MLRMLGKKSRLEIKGMQSSLPSLDHDLARHLRMNATEVAVGSRLGECISKRFIDIEGLRLKRLVLANNLVRDVIGVRPPNRCSYWNG